MYANYYNIAVNRLQNSKIVLYLIISLPLPIFITVLQSVTPPKVFDTLPQTQI